MTMGQGFKLKMSGQGQVTPPKEPEEEPDAK